MKGRVENWRDIPGYNGWYQISTEGRVRSYKAHGTRKTPGSAERTAPPPSEHQPRPILGGHAQT